MTGNSTGTDDLYSLSWSNPSCSHLLCAANVLDYFCDLSNPFYDRQCNNEVIRMQRLSPEQLLSMTGVEFYLHLAQEPILFVLRKQHRLSPSEVTPLAYYYVINGTVLQAPDLSTLLNSRLLTTVNQLNKVIQTLMPCVRYHPSDGSYSWDDPRSVLTGESHSDSCCYSDSETGGGPSTTLRRPSMAALPPTLFQVQRTDFLLAEWANRFPIPASVYSAAYGAPGSVTGQPQPPPPTSQSAVVVSGTPHQQQLQRHIVVKEEIAVSRLPGKLPPPPPPPVTVTAAVHRS